MSNRRVDHVSICIDEMLASLSRTPSKPFIFKVDDRLRRENVNAYEPEILAIGPYHHGKDNLQMMEERKLWFLQLLLERRNESSVDRYVMAMRELEERARRCYAQSISLDENEFVKMMVFDGCFIVELFRKYKMNELKDVHDPTFQLDRILTVLQHDLMLFENQLPFFILVQLFNMTKVPGPQDDIIDMAMYFLGERLPGHHVISGASTGILVDKVDHLLGLIHNSWCSSFAEMMSRSHVANQKEKSKFINCTTELRDAGIKFKKPMESSSLFNIKFKDGVMEIPPLMIESNTDSIFRNLIAYEQYHQNIDSYVTDYAIFMDCLINSAKDVEKLRHYRIIENRLGDDEAVSIMFNKLGSHDGAHFCYSEIFNDVNKHYRRCWSTRLVKFKRNFFNNPWVNTSFSAAALLLLLALSQTLFAILSYVK